MKKKSPLHERKTHSMRALWHRKRGIAQGTGGIDVFKQTDEFDRLIPCVRLSVEIVPSASGKDRSASVFLDARKNRMLTVTPILATFLGEPSFGKLSFREGL
jgi:hypothetical protein